MKKSLELIEALANLEDFDNISYIYIEGGYRSQSSKVVIIPIELIEIKSMKPPKGMEYLIEVETAKDVLKAWSFMRDGRVPSVLEKVIAILYYAKNDSFLPIE